VCLRRRVERCKGGDGQRGVQMGGGGRGGLWPISHILVPGRGVGREARF
jgi:hypothetical protein